MSHVIRRTKAIVCDAVWVEDKKHDIHYSIESLFFEVYNHITAAVGAYKLSNVR